MTVTSKPKQSKNSSDKKNNCPQCSKQTDVKYHPFCSKRCADIDLGNWLNGSYAIAGQSPFDSMEADEE